MEETDIKKTELYNEQAESRKLSNQKYYNKIKQDKQEKQEIKISNNNIECPPTEKPEIILNEESEDWSTWLYIQQSDQ